MAVSRHSSSKSTLSALLLVLLCLASQLMPVVEGIWLTIPSTGTKCFSEEIQNHVVVLADYHVIDDGEQQSDHHEQQHGTSTISAKVTSPYGNNLHHIENVTQGQFAFTTSEAGSYVACFWVDGKHQKASELTISLDWRIGIAARDWESVAKKEKIEGVELELKKLEGIVDAIHENLIYLKSREAEMREVSETTNTRAAWLSIMSLGVCIFVAVTQLWYLKTYFRKKKLI